MRKSSPALIFCNTLTGVAILFGSTTAAQDVKYLTRKDLSFQLSEQNRRIAHLETQLANYEMDDTLTTCDCGQPTCGACCNSCNLHASRSGGLIVGAELLWLRPFQSEGNQDSNYDTGYRGWIGWQTCSGLGLRGRYFGFEDTDRSPPNHGTEFTVNLRTVDLEVYDSLVIGDYWNVTVAGGIRYLNWQFHNTQDRSGGLEGVGPVISAALVRSVTSEINLFALARESFLVGQDQQHTTLTHDNRCGNVFETQLGIQYQHNLPTTAALFVRIAWEAQFLAGLDDDDSESATLMGGQLAVGLSR